MHLHHEQMTILSLPFHYLYLFIFLIALALVCTNFNGHSCFVSDLNENTLSVLPLNMFVDGF